MQRAPAKNRTRRLRYSSPPLVALSNAIVKDQHGSVIRISLIFCGLITTVERTQVLSSYSVIPRRSAAPTNSSVH